MLDIDIGPLHFEACPGQHGQDAAAAAKQEHDIRRAALDSLKDTDQALMHFFVMRLQDLATRHGKRMGMRLAQCLIRPEMTKLLDLLGFNNVDKKNALRMAVLGTIFAVLHTCAPDAAGAMGVAQRYATPESALQT